MNTKDYYDAHLGRLYSWMAGDFDIKCQEFSDFLAANNVEPTGSSRAYDLGAGHGIQTVALARSGFRVTAVDFSEHLLGELRANVRGLEVEILKADIRAAGTILAQPAELVVCWGDTLTHLDSLPEVTDFVRNMASILAPRGKLLLSFRDYTKALEGIDRFIPVKSDNDRILTCILDYEPDHVIVTDLLYERRSGGWDQRAMSYKKVRIDHLMVAGALAQAGFIVTHNQVLKGLVTIIASRR